MYAQITKPCTTEKIGRLAAPTARLPIPPASFSEIAARWRDTGWVLTLWNESAECQISDPNLPQFWKLLFGEWTQQNAVTPLRDFARSLVRRTFADSNPTKLLSESFAADIDMFAVPLLQRKKTVGVVIACGLNSPNVSEDLLQLFNRSQLDAKLMQSLKADLAIVAGRNHAPEAALLALTLDQARRLDQTKHEAADLTSALQSIYEELHLFHEVTNHMSSQGKRRAALQSVAEALHVSSRAAGIILVLDTDLRELIGPRTASSRFIVAGDLVPSEQTLSRLVEQIKPIIPEDRPHLLLNDVPSRDEFAWAGDWLNHVAAIPLNEDRRRQGLLLAINCRDEGDFNSADIKLFQTVADRIAAYLENHRLYDDLADLLMGLLHVLVSSIDAKDPYTCGHSERVAHIARKLAVAAGFAPDHCDRVYLAGILHDVGKIGVSDAILCKPGKLTEEEFSALKLHPEIGAKILSSVRQVQDLLPGVLHHHERMDGRGYPGKLEGSNIPLLGRLLCVADCFDAMTSNRTYRNAMPLDDVIAEIRRCRGTQFDPHFADIFLDLDLPHLMEELKGITGEPNTNLKQIADASARVIRPYATLATDVPMPTEVQSCPRL